MQNYPAELVATPRPLCFVLSELGGEGGVGDRLVAALVTEGGQTERLAQLRYKSVSASHRFVRKKDANLCYRAPDGRPLENYVVRGLLKTAWLRRQFLDCPSVIVVTWRISVINDSLPEPLSETLESLSLDISGRDVSVVLVLILPSPDGLDVSRSETPLISPETSFARDADRGNNTQRGSVGISTNVDSITAIAVEQPKSHGARVQALDKIPLGNDPPIQQGVCSHNQC